jgi:hypothetical protein
VIDERESVDDLASQRQVVVEHRNDDVHGGAPRGRVQPQAARWIEVDVARRRQLISDVLAAAKVRRGGAERANEGASERLRRGVAGVRGDVDDGVGGGGQPVRGALEQQSTAKRSWRLTNRRADESIEVIPRQIRTAGQVNPSNVRLIETLLDDLKDST